MDLGRAAVVRDLRLGGQRVRHDQGIALAGQQVRGAPVHLDDHALHVVDDDPVAHRIGLGGAEHDAREHVAERALDRQAEHDGQRARGRDQAAHRQLEHEGQRCHRRGEKHDGAEHVREQPLLAPTARQQEQVERERQQARAHQPPDDFEDLREPVQPRGVAIRRLAERAHVRAEQQPAQGREQREPDEQAGAFVGGKPGAPHEDIGRDDARGHNQRIFHGSLRNRACRKYGGRRRTRYLPVSRPKRRAGAQPLACPTRPDSSTRSARKSIRENTGDRAVPPGPAALDPATRYGANSDIKSKRFVISTKIGVGSHHFPSINCFCSFVHSPAGSRIAFEHNKHTSGESP